MAKREFLMLAHKYEGKKISPAGWFLSEKLDGMRCFWDGGLTRGFTKSDVPWANTAKDERYVERPIATGLWSRYGNVIPAPSGFLDALPKVPLDGELYIPGHRQDLMSIIKSLQPRDDDWKDVKFYCFDMPSFDCIFMDGVINTTNFKKRFVGCRNWIYSDTDISSLVYVPKMTTPFYSTYKLLQDYCSGVALPHNQVRLPFATNTACDFLNQVLEEVTAKGGEGVMLRKGESIWLPHRSHYLLKVKKLDDAEGTVIGYITGRETDLGSKLLGKMGALVLQLDSGQRMELSGFTDSERELVAVGTPGNSDATTWAIDNPGVECPEWITNGMFPRGSRVTFRYRGLTKDGIPQEARYWRKHE